VKVVDKSQVVTYLLYKRFSAVLTPVEANVKFGAPKRLKINLNLNIKFEEQEFIRNLFIGKQWIFGIKISFTGH